MIQIVKKYSMLIVHSIILMSLKLSQKQQVIKKSELTYLLTKARFIYKLQDTNKT